MQAGFVYNASDVKTIGVVLDEQVAIYGDKVYLYWKDEEVSYKGMLISSFFIVQHVVQLSQASYTSSIHINVHIILLFILMSRSTLIIFSPLAHPHRSFLTLV